MASWLSIRGSKWTCTPDFVDILMIGCTYLSPMEIVSRLDAAQSPVGSLSSAFCTLSVSNSSTTTMGLYWIDKPIVWKISRTPSGYDFDAMTEEQHRLIFSKWHDWWTADLDYAQTTVAFFCAAILASALLNVAARIRGRSASPGSPRPGIADKLTAALRYAAARQFYFHTTNWYTPPLAAILGVCGMCIFILTLTLAARPFYWPNDAMGMSQPIATRAGWISIAVMPFMIAFSTKINFVSLLTDTSHEKLQVFHRWAAFFMYITSLVHTFPFIITSIRRGMMEAMWSGTSLYWTGVAALVPQTYLILMSWGPIRSRYYETFKKLHFIAAGFFMAALFCHVDWTLTSWSVVIFESCPYKRASRHYFYATGAIYGLAWLTRVVRTLYTTGFGLPACIDSVGPDLIRLTIASRGFKWAPGQHVFIRVLGLGMHALTSHPFTISSVMTRAADDANANVELVLVLRARGGLTRALQRRIAGKPGWTTRVVLDGPYGGLHSPRALERYERVMFLAGGTGATFVLPLFADLLSKVKSASGSCKQVDFVVAVPDPDNYAWMAPQISTLVSSSAEISVNVRVHYTRTESADEKDIKDSGSDIVEVQEDNVSTLYGRPVLGEIVREASASASASTMAIIACGPDGFLYDVRNAVAGCQLDIADGFGGCKDLFLHTETYRRRWFAKGFGAASIPKCGSLKHRSQKSEKSEEDQTRTQLGGDQILVLVP
ncbi:ferric reductase NAD binding domain-containing protein [Mycena amicta]|nr:ferric reductase NAD binding domain-containing protein [Mycena amicta]